MRFTLPPSLLVLGLAVLISACGGPSSPTTPPLATQSADPGPGGALYKIHCIACHTEKGTGMEGMYPPLAGSEWVLGDKNKMLGVILNGLNGEVQVKGKTYNLVMTPYRDVLTDQQIADVATYVRSSWGNSASAVNVTDVAAVRASTAK